MFGNRPTFTTITSTNLVTTQVSCVLPNNFYFYPLCIPNYLTPQVVSYVTQTVANNPLAGLLG